MKNEHIASSVTELIGKTPLLRASRFAAAAGISNAPLLKLEYLNPAGSVKDRAALKMIEDAEKAGKLKPGAGYCRANLRQHGHRPRIYCSGARATAWCSPCRKP